MPVAKRTCPVLVFLGMMLMMAVSASCQDYIVMGTPLVNIRTGPSTDDVIVGRAEKGDIYKVVGRVEGWYEIATFSGDDRYVFAADYVYPLKQETLVPGHGMVLSEFKKDLRPIYLDIQEAKKRAMKEADEVIPVSIDKARNANFRKIMEDRIILETLHIHGLQSALYGDLMDEAGSRNW